MRSFIRYAVLSLLLLPAIATKAQMPADPTHWEYKVLKMDDHKYVAVFEVKLEEGWHIYALDPGGDGTAIPPSFIFDPNTEVIKEQEEVTEHGKLITETIEDFGTFRYYATDAKYTMPLRATKNTVLTGSHQYQVCNEMLCLPPVTRKFSFDIK